MPNRSGRKSLSDYPCYAFVLCLRAHLCKITNLDERERAASNWQKVTCSPFFAEQVKEKRKAAKVLNPIPCVPCDLATCKTRGLKLKGTNWASHPPSFPPGWDGPKCPTTSCRIEHFTKSWIRCQCRECEPRGLTYPREAGGTNIRTKLAATMKDGAYLPTKVSHFHYECIIPVGRTLSSKRKRGASSSSRSSDSPLLLGASASMETSLKPSTSFSSEEEEDTTVTARKKVADIHAAKGYEIMKAQYVKAMAEEEQEQEEQEEDEEGDEEEEVARAAAKKKAAPVAAAMTSWSQETVEDSSMTPTSPSAHSWEAVGAAMNRNPPVFLDHWSNREEGPVDDQVCVGVPHPVFMSDETLQRLWLPRS